MLCRKGTAQTSGVKAPVYLNVYDITPFNDCAYWLGLGAYHSGVQVYDKEYAYGGDEESTTSGIYKVKPKKSPGFTFRKSILIGWTDMKRKDISKVMEKLGKKYSGNSYSIITNNCNHFSNDACIKITGNSIPKWVNRLARFGCVLFKCVIPTDSNDIVKFQEEEEEEEEKACKVAQQKKNGKKISNSSSSSCSSSSFCTPLSLVPTNPS